MMTTTHRILKTLLLFAALACLVWLFVAYGEARASSGACSVKQAHRTAVEAAKTAREAERVYRATKAYSARYGKNTGRWVRLSRECDWPWAQIPQLMYVVDRESGGSPRAKNPTSTASGLLQFLAFHWDGTGDYGWQFDPFNARQNLRHGYLLYKHCGWSPWAL